MSTRDERKEPGQTGHEERDVNFRRVISIGFGVIGLMVFGLLLSWGVYVFTSRFTSRPGATPETFTPVTQAPPAPAVQSDPHADLVKLRASEDSVLISYGWVNRDSGTVRVPINRAIDLLLKQGLPVRQQAEPYAGDSGIVKEEKGR